MLEILLHRWALYNMVNLLDGACITGSNTRSWLSASLLRLGFRKRVLRMASALSDSSLNLIGQLLHLLGDGSRLALGVLGMHFGGLVMRIDSSSSVFFALVSSWFRDNDLFFVMLNTRFSILLILV